MSNQQKLLLNTVINLPDDAIEKILEYIVSLGYNVNVLEAPEHLIIKNKDDLIKKLEEGMSDTEEISFEDVVKIMDEKIS